MNVQIFINGQDKTTSLISYNRSHNICTGIGAGTFVFKSGITGILPYSSVVLYEESVKKATYFVAAIVNAVTNGGFTTTLEVQDGTKMMADYFVDEILYVQNTAYMASDRIAHYLDLAKITYIFDTYEGDSTLDGDSTWGPASCIELVTQLMQQCGWYLYFDADNVCHINHMGYISAANTILDGHTLSYASNKNDTMVRNRAVIYGKYTSGGYITAEAQTTTDYDIDAGDVKTVVLANHNIGSSSKANELANMLITEFGRTSETRTVILTGAGDYDIGDAVTLDLTVAKADCLVTDVKVSMNSGGLTTTLTLDERCPRLFAFMDGVFTPDPLPAGWVASSVSYTPVFSGIRQNYPIDYVSVIPKANPTPYNVWDAVPESVIKPSFVYGVPIPIQSRNVITMGAVDSDYLSVSVADYGSKETGPYYSLYMPTAFNVQDYNNVHAEFNKYYGYYQDTTYHLDRYGSEMNTMISYLPTPSGITTLNMEGTSFVYEYAYTGSTMYFDAYSMYSTDDGFLLFTPSVSFVYSGVSIYVNGSGLYMNNPFYINTGDKVKIIYSGLANLTQDDIDYYYYDWEVDITNKIPLEVSRTAAVKWAGFPEVEFNGKIANTLPQRVVLAYQHYNDTSNIDPFYPPDNAYRAFKRFLNPSNNDTNIYEFSWHIDHSSYPEPSIYVGDEVVPLTIYNPFVMGIPHVSAKYEMVTLGDKYSLYLYNLTGNYLHNGKPILQKYTPAEPYIIDHGNDYYTEGPYWFGESLYKLDVAYVTDYIGMLQAAEYARYFMRIYQGWYSYTDAKIEGWEVTNPSYTNTTKSLRKYTLLQVYWDDPVNKKRYRISL